MDVRHDPAASYRARAELHARSRDEARARARTLSNARLAAFLAFLLAVTWLATTTAASRTVAGVVVALSLVTFLFLVRVHSRVRESARWHGRLHDVAMMGEARVRRDWARLPAPPPTPVPPDHPFANDLDVFGRASLFALADTVSAFPGRRALERQLTEGAHDAAEVASRQAAVRELVDRRELREALHALARSVGELRAGSFDRFLAWAEGPTWLAARPMLRAAAWVIPALTIATIVLAAAGPLDGRLVLLPLVAGGLVVAANRRAIGETLDAATARAIGLRQHAPMLALLEAERFGSPPLTALHARIAAEGGASSALRALDSALGLAESRAGGMGYAVLALVLLWDVHAVAALERWQTRHGRHVRDWLDALGQFEALAALATLADDNPEWCFPDVFDAGARHADDGSSGGDDTTIHAEALAHPLLPPETRVANDVRVGPAGTILLVTGSNMSGKSTLLRAIGANIVLAQAGGPVCARRLRLPMTRLYTSMRIQDSLAQGLSLFMAELQRIRDLVAAARTERARPFLCLLDEILHGTNTAERQIAARMVLAHLVHAGAMSVVTTHDLALAEPGELAHATRHVHFEECFVDTGEATQMTFDYVLRPGPATSANALRLLAMVGLGTAPSSQR